MYANLFTTLEVGDIVVLTYHDDLYIVMVSKKDEYIRCRVMFTYNGDLTENETLTIFRNNISYIKIRKIYHNEFFLSFIKKEIEQSYSEYFI